MLRKMSTGSDNSSGALLLSHRLFLAGSVFLLAILVASTFVALAQQSTGTINQASTSFGFTFAGDYAQTSSTTANLQYIKQQASANKVSFNIGLGDFSYETSSNADAWSTYVKSNLPANFPFEIVAGRHDVSQLTKYASDLPNRVGTITGTYTQQYYFDFPSGGTPLARLILISPNQTIPGHSYNYNKGGADYNWVSNAIDAAHTAGIRWVIIGMHQYCFAIGYASCLNQDLLDLLLSKHVDVILQAQKHNYQRSKQLALNTSTCKTLSATSYNANCVANATSSLTQGAGSVIVLTGTGGEDPQLAVNTSDHKTGYFKTWMPANNVTWGISQFTISATQLTEHFVATSGGTYTDSFTITSSATSAPASTPGATPSSSP